MSADRGAVAVLNCDADALAVWHVATDPGSSARLCVAWITADTTVQQKITSARPVVIVGGATDERVAALLAATEGAIDIAATLTSIANYVDTLDRQHRISRTSADKPRAPIVWPKLMDPPNGQSPHPVPAGVVDEPLIRATVGAASWLAQLIDTWFVIEALRVSRTHLVEDAPDPRRVPFALTND